MHNLTTMPEDGIMSFELADRTWRMLRTPDLESLWQQLGPEDFADERIPYWTEIWPSSLALAAWLTTHDLGGKTCLDLGCGLGLTAMAGVAARGRVLACDYEPAALDLASRNAALNGLESEMFFCMDWRRPCIRPGSIDLIWAADILYEKRSFEPVLALLGQALQKDGLAWIAEPGRIIFREFRQLAARQGWQIAPVWKEKVRPLQADAKTIEPVIWQFAPAR